MRLLILILLPMLTACLGYIFTKKAGENSQRIYYGVTLASAAAVFAAALWIVLSGDTAFNVPFICGLGINIEIDGFRRVYIIVLSFMWLLATAFSREYFSGHHRLNRLFFFLMMTEGAIMGVFLASDLFTALIFFEIMSFTSFPWVIQEETEEAIKAANTYLAIAVIGGLAALMGIFILWNELGTVILSELYTAAGACPDKAPLYVAGGCILFGFGAKAGMFPLHIWLPKAHPVAPAPTSALLSGALTKSGVWGMLALSCNIFREDPAWGTVILCLGTVTMLLGAVLALFSVNLKRTLACSSMSQIGFIMIGVAMMGLLGEENALAARGTILHMLNHSLFKLVLFICAGVVFMNTEELDLNKIRGWGRGKPFLNVCFLLGAAGIAGIPGLNGYVSKTLLHEAIVEGAAVYGPALNVVEWIFLISGGLTLAYMTKLYVCLFIDKPYGELQTEEKKSSYISPLSRAALGLAAILVPALGFTANISMDAIATLGTDFFNAAKLEHSVNYFSIENLKGGLISIAIGFAIYFLIVRTALIKDSAYLDRFPKHLDLEILYRALLLKWLPGFFGTICAIFAENKISRRVASAVNRGAGAGAEVFAENHFSAPFAKGAYQVIALITHALSDLLDAAVLLLKKTVFKNLRSHSEVKAENTLQYRIGDTLDRALVKHHKETEGEHSYARLNYRFLHTLRHATHDLFDSLSFALFLLALAICLILIYVLVIYVGRY